MGGEGRGELVVWLVKNKGMCKSKTAIDHPDHSDQQKHKPKKNVQLQ